MQHSHTCSHTHINFTVNLSLEPAPLSLHPVILSPLQAGSNRLGNVLSVFHEHSPDSAFMGMFDVRVHKEQSVNPTPKYRDPTVSLRPKFQFIYERVCTCARVYSHLLLCVYAYTVNFPYVHIERMMYFLSMFKQPEG